MTQDQIRETVKAILLRLMPGANTGALAGGVSLRNALAADSMDILNFVSELQGQFGVEIPEQDYPLLDTLDGCAGYLFAATGERKQTGTGG